MKSRIELYELVNERQRRRLKRFKEYVEDLRQGKKPSKPLNLKLDNGILREYTLEEVEELIDWTEKNIVAIEKEIENLKY